MEHVNKTHSDLELNLIHLATSAHRYCYHGIPPGTQSTTLRGKQQWFLMW